MTVPTAGTPPEAPGQCTSCTVPTTRPDGLCSFCADPPPPLDNPRTRLMDSAANHAHCALFDVEKQIQGMPADAVLWASVDADFYLTPTEAVELAGYLIAAVEAIAEVR